MIKEVEKRKKSTRSIESYASQAGISKKRAVKNHASKTSFVGSALISKLWARMNEQGETPIELAKRFGISYSYLMLLGKGKRDVTGIKLEQLREIAKYLDMPVASAACLGGFFEPRDFYLQASLDERVEIAFKQLKNDPLVGSFAIGNEVWNSMPKEVKFLIAVLFENGGSTKLLEPAKLYRIV